MTERTTKRAPLQRHGFTSPAPQAPAPTSALRDPALAQALALAITTRDRGIFRMLGPLSGLPGPRPNVALARALADDVTRAGHRADAFVRELLALDADRAPPGSAGEYFPFVGALALAARHRAGIDPKGAIDDLHTMAEDVRKLVRSGVVLALREVAHGRERDLPDLLAGFMDGYLHAAVALEALTGRDVLTAIGDASGVVARLDDAFRMVEEAPRAHERTQGLRSLVHVLGVAQAAALVRFPRELLPWLTERAATKHPDLRRAIDDTLARFRDGGHAATVVADVRRALAASAPVRRDAARVVDGTRGRGKKAGRSGRRR